MDNPKKSQSQELIIIFIKKTQFLFRDEIVVQHFEL